MFSIFTKVPMIKAGKFNGLDQLGRKITKADDESGSNQSELTHIDMEDAG